MKKLLTIILLVTFYNSSFAEDFNDWTNEDLCRWVDSVSIPEPISIEINLREIVCFDAFDSSQFAIEMPKFNEHGTIFPSPSRKDKKKLSGLNFIFNYKITL